MDSAAANASFTANPLDFAKRHALSPGEDAGVDVHVKNRRGIGPTFERTSTLEQIKKKLLPAGANTAGPHHKAAQAMGLPKLLNKIKPIRNRFRKPDQITLEEYQEQYQLCYGKFEKKSTVGDLQFGLYAIDFRPAATADAGVRAQRFPCWFLPWDQSAAMIHMTIPRTTYNHTKAGTHRPSAAGAADPAWGDFATNPPYFFTSGLSGCSVFISGSADNPTIYHAGVGTSLYDNASGKAVKLDARSHWHESFKAANPAAYAAGAFSEVHKLHYSGPSLDQLTPRIENYSAALANGGLNITFKKAFGCVFGLRTGMTWEFYLQEVVSLTYIRPSTNTVVTVPRPIALRKIFPGTVSNATILNETQIVKALPM